MGQDVLAALTSKTFVLNLKREYNEFHISI